MTIVVGTTLCAYAMENEEIWGSWLINAQEIIDSHGGDVQYFVAIQQDGRGMEPFDALVDNGNLEFVEFWSYSYNDGRTEVKQDNRIPHITMGQNVVVDYCRRDPAISHLLFLAADTEPPPDILPKLLEMDHPIVGPFISTYGFLPSSAGVNTEEPGFDFPVRRGMISAAAILLRRDLFSKLNWRYDTDAGMTDDPCMEHDARTLFGFDSLIRMDIEAKHHPECIGPVETRGADMKVVR